MVTQAITKADMIGILGLSISNAELEDFNSISLMVQNEVTRSLLGDDLFNDFTTDFDAGSGTPTEQKWLDLLLMNILMCRPKIGTTPMKAYMKCWIVLDILIRLEISSTTLWITVV